MYQPEKLKAQRKKLKMTQKDIADQLDISYQAFGVDSKCPKRLFYRA